jgi:hypothetical protein
MHTAYLGRPIPPRGDVVAHDDAVGAAIVEPREPKVANLPRCVTLGAVTFAARWHTFRSQFELTSRLRGFCAQLSSVRSGKCQATHQVAVNDAR